MTVLLPAWLQAGSYTGELDRKPLTALGAPIGGTSLFARGGAFRGMGGEFAVAQTGTASMSVTVGSGYASVGGSYTLTQGNYIVSNDATVTLTVTAANGANPRIDLMVLEVLDSAYSGASDLAQLRIVPGVPGASPAIPSTPPSAIALARITVGAGATSITNSNITDVRQFAGTSTGILPVSAGDTGNGAFVGQYRDQPSAGLQRWTGSGWTANWGTISTAPLAAGWTGAVQYSVSNRVVFLNVQVTRSTAVSLSAWQGVTIATGLPTFTAGGGGTSYGLGMALTNADRDGGYQINANTNGSISLVSRWESKTFGATGWVAYTGFYPS